MNKRAYLLVLMIVCWIPWLTSQTYSYHQTLPLSTIPGRLVLDNQGALYVALPGTHQVLKLSLTDGSELAAFGQSGTSGNTNALLNGPVDVELDAAGNVYIADRGNSRIVKYDASQNFQWAIDLSPKMPEGVTVGPDGKLYICYSGDGVGLLVYNETSLEQTITTLSSDRFRDPKKVRFDSQNKLYIADRNTGIIKSSGLSGNQVLVEQVIKKENGSTIIVKSMDVAFTKQGSLLVPSMEDKVTDGLYQGIYRFNTAGLFVDHIGVTGASSGIDGFAAPLCTACDDNDNLYVSDTGNNRIQIWKATDEQAPEVKQFTLLKNSVSDVTFSYAMNETGSFYGLFREEGQPEPDVSEIINPAPGSLSFNTLYSQPNVIVTQTEGSLEANKIYHLYYVAEDDAANRSFVQSSEAFLTTSEIIYLVSDTRQATQVSLLLNSRLAGTAWYVIESYTGQNPQYTTSAQIKAASNAQSLNYPTGGEQLSISLSDLNAAESYRISMFIENTDGLETPVVYTIFTTYNDVARIRQRYVDWCVGGDDMDYTNSLILARYQAIYAEGAGAINNLDQYDADNPGETYDLVNSSEHMNHIKTLIRETLFPLALLYNVPGPSSQPNPHYKNATTRQQLMELYRYLSARGFVSGCNSEFKGGGVYLGLTGYFYASMLLRQELDMAGYLKEVSNNMVWWTRWELIGLTNQPWNYEQKSALKQADFVRTFYNNHLMSLLTLPDEVLDIEVRMGWLADVCNEACELSNGWGGFIKPDHTGFHHHGIWGSAYVTEAMHVSALMSWLLNDTPYAYSETANTNIAEALLAYRFYCNKYDNPKSLSGRFPTNQGDLLLHMPAYAYQQAVMTGDVADNLKSAFRRLWEAPESLLQNELATDVAAYIQFRGGLGGLQQQINLAAATPEVEAAPSGNRVFPYGNLLVHRRAEWMASVKGYSKYVWDYESNGEQNWFGRNQSAGALELFANEESAVGGVSAAASGWHEDGYDWDHVAGATAFDLPAWTDHDKSYIWAKFSPEYFVGGVSSKQQDGLFAMKYVDVRETGWVQRDYKLTAKKSYFFFDDQIICLGTDIQSIHPTYKVHTTLYQNFLSDTNTPTSINGGESSGLGLDYSHPDQSAVSLTDATGNAYYLPDASELRVTRLMQTSRDNRDTKDTNGEFAKAWLDHGLSSNGKYEYLVWVQAPAGGIEQMATQPENWYVVEKKDAAAHVVTHVSTKKTGYAIFQPDQVIDCGVVYSTNNDCLIMTAEENFGFTLSVAHPDLGWLDKNQSLYQVWSVSDANRWLPSVEQAVEITLNGNWQTRTTDPSVTFVKYENNRTTYRFNCLEGKTLEVEFEENPSNDVGDNPQSDGFKLYPNPNNGAFTLEAKEIIKQVEVLDVNGTVIHQICGLNDQQLKLDLSLPSGSYIIRVQTSGEVVSRKMVIL
jgi:hypothetical protein